MKKVEIVRENGRIVLNEYAGMNSKSPFFTKFDEDVRNYLREKMKNYYLKQSYNSNTVLEFQNPSTEYDGMVFFLEPDVLEDDYVKPLKDMLTEKKKVTRKNRHVGKKIVASVLVIATLVTVALTSKKNSKNISDKSSTDTSMFGDGMTPTDTASDNINESNTTETVEESESSLTDTPESEIPDESVSDEIDSAEDSISEGSDKVYHISYDEPTTAKPSYDITIDYSNVTPDYSKLEYVKENYGDIIEKYANTYGVDPRIIIAIATQERGIHSPYMDRGGATGLMQIQNSVWIGNELTAFNYDIDDKETIIVTDKLLSSLEGNIKVGCMIFSDCMKQMKGNVFAAIQCYNMGQGNLNRKVFPNYCAACGKTREEVLGNPTDIGWLGCRRFVTQGDRYYLERILSYIDEDVISINCLGFELHINGMQNHMVR